VRKTKQVVAHFYIYSIFFLAQQKENTALQKKWLSSYKERLLPLVLYKAKVAMERKLTTGNLYLAGKQWLPVHTVQGRWQYKGSWQLVFSK
jgi:hypothetical protein